MEEIKDIKPLLEIPDISYYIYWGLISFGITLVTIIIFFLIKRLWQSRKVNRAKEYLRELKKIDWSDTKESAYKATHYARLLATDDRKRELFSQLEEMLEQYKYKKEVNEVDDDTQAKFNLYVQVADGRI